jgi:hypothetical protein
VEAKYDTETKLLLILVLPACEASGKKASGILNINKMKQNFKDEEVMKWPPLSFFSFPFLKLNWHCPLLFFQKGVSQPLHQLMHTVFY